MTLQSSGQISLSNIASEMGGSTPHSLSEYYKNGGLVGNHTNNPNVPTSGTISFSNFYGANNTAPVTANNFAVMTQGSHTDPAKYGGTYYGYEANGGSISTNNGLSGGLGSSSDNTIFANGTNFTISGFWTVRGIVSLPHFSVVGNYDTQSASSLFGYTSVKWGSITVVTNMGIGNYSSTFNRTNWGGTIVNDPSGTANITFA